MATTLKRQKEVVMPRRPNGVFACKKHPKHVQSPGVCSLCLTDKLSQILSKNEKKRVVKEKEEEEEEEQSLSSSPSSISSYVSSSLGSSCSSPMHRNRYMVGNEGKGLALSCLFTSGKNVLSKSRSLAFVQRNKGKKDGRENINIGGDDDEKKSGFWSKLMLRSSSRYKNVEEGEFVRSRTIRETVDCN